jgi:hypothetical protein
LLDERTQLLVNRVHQSLLVPLLLVHRELKQEQLRIFKFFLPENSCDSDYTQCSQGKNTPLANLDDAIQIEQILCVLSHPRLPRQLEASRATVTRIFAANLDNVGISLAPNKDPLESILSFILDTISD